MKSLKGLLFLILLCLCLPGVSAGGSLQMIQDGWAFGGPLKLSFTGEDLNLDGRLEQSELSAFKAVYDLPHGGSTEWLIDDIEPDGFMFSDVGDFLIFATNPEYSLVDTAFEGEVLASVFDRFLFPIDETQAAPIVTPEPTGMVWIGLTTIVALVRWRDRRARPVRTVRLLVALSGRDRSPAPRSDPPSGSTPLPLLLRGLVER